MKKNQLFTEIISILLSAFLTACAVNFFFRFNGLAPGGLTGLALVLSTLFKVDVSLMVLCISIPLLAIASLVIGKQFGIKTIIITIMTPLFIKIVPAIWLSKPLTLVSVDLELGVSAILAGLLIGSSISLSIGAQCATGGTDVVAMLIQKMIPQVTLSKIIFMLDGLIILSTSLINKNFSLSLYSLFSLLIIVLTIHHLTKPKQKNLKSENSSAYTTH